jgi:hypothetical protein
MRYRIACIQPYINAVISGLASIRARRADVCNAQCGKFDFVVQYGDSSQ